jgi:hypothetical protein
MPPVLMPRVLKFLMTTAEARRALATARGGIMAFVWIGVLRRTPRSRQCGIDEALARVLATTSVIIRVNASLVAEPRTYAVIGTLRELVRKGFAMGERRTMRAGQQRVGVTWLAITDAGRLALGE